MESKTQRIWGEREDENGSGENMSMRKREIEQYMVVNIYDKMTRTSESSATLGNLIETMEIKDF